MQGRIGFVDSAGLVMGQYGLEATEATHPVGPLGRRLFARQLRNDMSVMRDGGLQLSDPHLSCERVIGIEVAIERGPLARQIAPCCRPSRRAWIVPRNRLGFRATG